MISRKTTKGSQRPAEWLGSNGNRRDKAFKDDEFRVTASRLLATARALARETQRFHLVSYAMADFKEIAYTGVYGAEINFCRDYIERSDRLQADIDRLTATTNEGKT